MRIVNHSDPLGVFPREPAEIVVPGPVEADQAQVRKRPVQPITALGVGEHLEIGNPRFPIERDRSLVGKTGPSQIPHLEDFLFGDVQHRSVQLGTKLLPGPLVMADHRIARVLDRPVQDFFDSSQLGHHQVIEKQLAVSHRQPPHGCAGPRADHASSPPVHVPGNAGDRMRPTTEFESDRHVPADNPRLPGQLRDRRAIDRQFKTKVIDLLRHPPQQVAVGLSRIDSRQRREIDMTGDDVGAHSATDAHQQQVGPIGTVNRMQPQPPPLGVNRKSIGPSVVPAVGAPLEPHLVLLSVGLLIISDQQPATEVFRITHHPASVFD